MNRSGDSAFRRSVNAVSAGILAALAGVLMILYMFSSAFGGFSFALQSAKISCQSPWKQLSLSLLCWALWAGLGRAGGRTSGVPPGTTQRTPDPPSAVVARWGSIFLTALTAFLWMRALYRSYERFLLHMRDGVSVPFWQIHVLYAAVLIGALGAWRGLRRSEGAFAGLATATLFALSPALSYVSPAIAGGYLLIALVWILSGAMAGRSSAPRVRAHFAAMAAAGMIGLMLFAGFTGRGWSGNRLIEQITSRCTPDLAAAVAVAGIAGWFLTRSQPRPWLAPAFALGLVGVVLGGARQETGYVGAVLLLPLGAGLVAVGVSFLRARSALGQSALGRNLVVLMMLGILFGTLQQGLRHSISPPPDVREERQIKAEPVEEHDAGE